MTKMKTRTVNPTLYNFGAGPACLPGPVLQKIRDDIPDWYDGMSIMEISHRLPVVVEFTQKIEANFRKLLDVPDDFAVLFMQGGARAQFSAVILNLLGSAATVDYLVTGHWSQIAAGDAKRYCNVNVVATGEKDNFTHIPDPSVWNFSKDSPFLHYTDNETIHGVEFSSPPDAPKWLVSDMTSNIASRPIDFNRFGCIYASAQKNLGIAGITVVMVRRDLLGRAHPFTPPVLNYQTCSEAGSMFNTPPLFCWYVLGLVVDWALQQGGMTTLFQRCKDKAKLVYDVIDQSDFYINMVSPRDRSTINIPFSMPSESLEALFLTQANTENLKQLKGHKAVGGCRASLYNAMPVEGAKQLADFMKHFEKTYG